MDFKENIKIGGGPIEITYDYYHKQYISVLGTCIIYKDENGNTKTKYIDFFSEILNHDSKYTSDCLYSLLKLNKYKNI